MSCAPGLVCDSFPIVFGTGGPVDGDDGWGSRVLRRQAPAKKGRRVLERMRLRKSVGLRALGDDRAEQAGLARFFRNPRVTVEEILATAGEHTAEAAAGRHVLLIEDTSEINY